MLRGLHNFNQALKKAHKRLTGKFVLIQKKLAMDILRGTVKKTPVDTGRARGNWQMSVENPVVEEIDGVGTNPVTEGLGAVAGLKFGQTIFICNNVFYALYLEEGTPYMKAHKMLDLTIKEVTSELE